MKLCLIIMFNYRYKFWLRTGLHAVFLFQVIALKESIQVDNLVSSSLSSDVAPPPPKAVQEMPESFRLAAPMSDGELTALLLSSPLYHKLDAVKNLIRGGAGKGGAFHAPGK